jgi:hypothetical protein
MRTKLSIATIAACTAMLPAATASAAVTPISGTITPVTEGACTPPSVEGPHVRWQCTGATERYDGDLSSAADAVYSVRGAFNMQSGVTRTGGRETFTGCAGGQCGTLEWSWHVTFRTVPETLELLGAHGQARITGGSGDLAGAKGSFTIACEPLALCTYEGHLQR